jgi:hypothetical protein
MPARHHPQEKVWGIVAAQHLFINICNVVKAAAIAKTAFQEAGIYLDLQGKNALSRCQNVTHEHCNDLSCSSG